MEVPSPQLAAYETGSPGATPTLRWSSLAPSTPSEALAASDIKRTEGDASGIAPRPRPHVGPLRRAWQAYDDLCLECWHGRASHRGVDHCCRDQCRCPGWRPSAEHRVWRRV